MKTKKDSVYQILFEIVVHKNSKVPLTVWKLIDERGCLLRCRFPLTFKMMTYGRKHMSSLSIECVHFQGLKLSEILIWIVQTDFFVFLFFFTDKRKGLQGQRLVYPNNFRGGCLPAWQSRQNLKQGPGGKHHGL